MARDSDDQINFPIIDSHIHLYAGSHIQDLAWAPSLANSHVLKQQNSVEQYRAASSSQPRLRGFVFVETDRKSSLEEDGWQYAVEEIEFVRRIKSGTLLAGEGHASADKTFILGAVVWAPLGAPIDRLQRYLENIGAAEDLQRKNGLIRGFRYLLQDKPPGTCLKEEFIDGLLLLENMGARAFDVGVDFRQGGSWQLVEAEEMLRMFGARSNGKMKFVINHLCKPHLQVQTDAQTQAANFEGWRECIEQLARFPSTYMKLSGLFSEFEPQATDEPAAISDLLESSRPYRETIFKQFGRGRIMFGSDWPVCNVGGPGSERSWTHWVNFVRAVLDEQGLSEAEKAEIWAGCAKTVYDLSIEL